MGGNTHFVQIETLDKYKHRGLIWWDMNLNLKKAKKE